MYLSNKVRGSLFIVASSLSLIFSFATYASSVDPNAAAEGQAAETASAETSTNQAATDVRSSLDPT